MDTGLESLPQPEKIEFPRKGDVFRVINNEEINGAGGLMLHHVEEEAGVLKGGPDYLEDKIVRMPVGAKVTVEQAFKDDKGVWIIFDYPYLNPNQGQKTLRACAMVEKISTFSRTLYMEKVTETASALDQLKMEIQDSQQKN